MKQAMHWTRLLFCLGTLYACNKNQGEAERKDYPIDSSQDESPIEGLHIYGGTSGNIYSGFVGSMLAAGRANCTISKIGPRTFLTAAHCTGNFPGFSGQLASGGAPDLEATKELSIRASDGSEYTFKIAKLERKPIVVDSTQVQDYAMISVYFGRNAQEFEASNQFMFSHMPDSGIVYNGAPDLSRWVLSLGAGSFNLDNMGDDGLLLADFGWDPLSQTFIPGSFESRGMSDPRGIRASQPTKVINYGGGSGSGFGCAPFQASKIDDNIVGDTIIKSFFARDSDVKRCAILPGDSGGPLLFTNRSGTTFGGIIGVNQGASIAGDPINGFTYQTRYSKIDFEAARRERIRPVIDYYKFVLDQEGQPVTKLYADREYEIELKGHNLHRLRIRFSSSPTRFISLNSCDPASNSCFFKFKTPRPKTRELKVNGTLEFYYMNPDKIIEKIDEQAESRSFEILNVYEARSCPLVIDMTVKQPSWSQTFLWSELVFPVHSLAPRMPTFKTINPTIYFPEGQDTLISQKIDPKIGTDEEIQEAWCQRLPTEGNICSAQWFGPFYEAGQLCSNYVCSYPSPCKTFTITADGKYYDGLTDEEASYFGYLNPTP